MEQATRGKRYTRKLTRHRLRKHIQVYARLVLGWLWGLSCPAFGIVVEEFARPGQTFHFSPVSCQATVSTLLLKFSACSLVFEVQQRRFHVPGNCYDKGTCLGQSLGSPAPYRAPVVHGLPEGREWGVLPTRTRILAPGKLHCCYKIT